MRHRSSFALTAALATVLVITACGGGTGPSIDEPDGGLRGSWQLVEGRGPEGPVPILDSHRVTLTFEDDDRLGGTAACNHYGGEIQVDGAEIEIGAISVTEMACEPPEAMDSERAYLDALSQVTSFEDSQDRLTLSGPDTELVYERLEPPPTADLTGTRWELDSLLQGTGPDGTASSARGGYLLLQEDGTLTGSTGCRELSGEWTETGDTLATPSLTADGECPAELREQDAHVIQVLEGGFRAEVEGENLTLIDPNGEVGLRFRAG